MLSEDGILLRIFIGESDRYEGRALYDWVIKKALEHDIAGATVLRGIAGFGADRRLYTNRTLRLSLDLPLVVELVDRPEKIEEFIPVIDSAIGKGLMTTERVQVRSYRMRSEEKQS